MADNHNLFFYANTCHICKRFGDSVKLKRCGGCRMISYCNQHHQRQHWSQHKYICKAISDVLKNHVTSYLFTKTWDNITLEEWINIKMNLMLLVAMKLPRRLEQYEQQMFKFPRACMICHKRDGKALLEDCQNCASVSFCTEHRDNSEHKGICDLLKLCLNLDVLSMNVERKLPSFDCLQYHSDKKSFKNMREFTSTYVNIENETETLSDEYSAAEYSEYLTRPLTLLFGIQTLNYFCKNENLVIHIMGANMIEIVTIDFWEILLHLLPAVISIKIIMIGPELSPGNFTHNICSNCMLNNRELLFELHNVLYEHYVSSSLFVKTDLIIGFNAGIHECEDIASSRETWISSIQALAKQNCPFILSCYTKQEAKKDITRINTILNNEVEYVYNGKNPFSSLRPYRDYETEHVFYENNYVIIYRNLCS